MRYMRNTQFPCYLRIRIRYFDGSRQGRVVWIINYHCFHLGSEIFDHSELIDDLGHDAQVYTDDKDEGVRKEL